MNIPQIPPVSDPGTEERAKLQFEKYKFNVEVFKWFIVSVVLVVITLKIDTGFRSRSAGVTEITQYDKYVNELVILNPDIGPKRALAQYFSHVIASEELRKGWKNYYTEIEKEYVLILKELDSLRSLERRLGNIAPSKRSTEQVYGLQKVRGRIHEINSQLEAEIRSPEREATGEFLVVIEATATLQEAKARMAEVRTLDLPSWIFKKGNMYRIVAGPFSERSSAQGALPSIAATINKGAYIVRGDSWCRNASFDNAGGYYECR